MESPTLAFTDSHMASTNEAALEEASTLSTKARELDALGSYYEAERLLRQALELVGPCTPSSSPTFARLSNGLGETYLHMGRLDDAEECFSKSLDASVAVRDLTEIAASRENLARVQRAKRELFKAKALRMLGAPDDMRCSNYNVRSQLFPPPLCPRTLTLLGPQCAGALLRSPDFRICGGCKVSCDRRSVIIGNVLSKRWDSQGAFYCSINCQVRCYASATHRLERHAH